MLRRILFAYIYLNHEESHHHPYRPGIYSKAGIFYVRQVLVKNNE